MISFLLTISITIQYTLAINPTCDGTQIVYATPPSRDPVTGEIIGAGLDAITLSVDEVNTIISNVIGIASDMLGLTPDQQPEMELIRSATINPLTTDLVLLFQEVDFADPLMNEPRQRLIIIPGFKLNSLLVESPGILGYEIQDVIDLAETELDQEYPLTEIAFDCAGNLLGVTALGDLVQMIIEPGSSDLETRYIGPIAFQGGLVGLITGFVGLTYDFQTNTFIAVGGLPVANTLVQFAVCECDIIQFGNPVIVTDEFGLCPLGIVDIESRGNDQFYITCAIDGVNFGLAMLELVNGVAEILPLNAAEGTSLVPLPNSSGGAIIPSIPSGTAATDVNANAICFPRNIGAPTCSVVPTESDCEGDITIQLSLTPPNAAATCSVGVPPQAGIGANGAVPDAGAGGAAVNVGPVSGSYGVGPASGTYGVPGDYGANGVYGYPSVGATGLGTSFNGEVVPGTAGTGIGAGGLGFGQDYYYYNGFRDEDSPDYRESVSEEEIEEVLATDTDTNSEEEEEDTASASDDDVDASDDDTSADDEDTSTDDDDDDTASDDDTDSMDEGDVSDDDDIENGSDDGGSDDDDSFDGDGDESVDDDDDLERDSVDPYEIDFERGSAEDAQLNGNSFNRNGLLAEDGYGYNNGEGTVISLSPSTLANLWGLAMIFLGINLTFLCICYYRNGQCTKKQVTMDDADADIESL